LRVGVVTDIHSNLVALEAVLTDLGFADELWCLGDIVGYGPWPNECIQVLRDRSATVIGGNHDLAVVGSSLVSVEDFNADAADATRWTAEQLTPESRKFLEGLAPIAQLNDQVTLAHGTPREPVWEYLMSGGQAKASLSYFSTSLCLVGHTHIPSLFVEQPDGTVEVGYKEGGSRYQMADQRCLANPGSVGQPRDHDTRAAYLLLELGERPPVLEWRRVDYDIGATQSEMRRVGLPRFFIERLEQGV
jgi:diadenosine tetraphosphatase ApaH/serine/threonine PP2A family protein phosphatase